ncbi:hypothetical protein [Nonomuraea sp. NPDC049400]
MNAGKVDFSDITDEGVTWTLLGTLYLRARQLDDWSAACCSG